MEVEVFNGQLCSKRNVRNRTGIGRLKHWEHVSSSCTNGLEHGAAYGDGGYRPQQRRLGYKVLFSATIFWTDDVSSGNPRLYDEGFGAQERRTERDNGDASLTSYFVRTKWWIWCGIEGSARWRLHVQTPCGVAGALGHGLLLHRSFLERCCVAHTTEFVSKNQDDVSFIKSTKPLFGVRIPLENDTSVVLERRSQRYNGDNGEVLRAETLVCVTTLVPWARHCRSELACSYMQHDECDCAFGKMEVLSCSLSWGRSLWHMHCTKVVCASTPHSHYSLFSHEHCHTCSLKVGRLQICVWGIVYVYQVNVHQVNVICNHSELHPFACCNGHIHAQHRHLSLGQHPRPRRQPGPRQQLQ